MFGPRVKSQCCRGRFLACPDVTPETLPQFGRRKRSALATGTQEFLIDTLTIRDRCNCQKTNDGGNF